GAGGRQPSADSARAPKHWGLIENPPRTSGCAPPRVMVVGLLLAARRGMASLVSGGGRAHSPAGSRAPRTLVTAIPMVNTSAAQIAAPRACGGRAGQIQGVVSAGGCHWVCSP